ncbi:MAG: F420-dependent NADP oxidoreductase [Rikenellaceae bacterium]
MISVSIIGSGNVAEAFAVALSQLKSDEVFLREVAGRNPQRLAQIGELIGCQITTIEALSTADLYILAVSDGAIEEVAQQIKQKAEGATIVHTAGAIPMGELSGVIYPMQTFTKGREVNFQKTPLFIEAKAEVPTDPNDPNDPKKTIIKVAKTLSKKVIELNSESRRSLHLAAVFACNFTNAMFSATESILTRANLDLSLYRPLVEECVAKVFECGIPPIEAQTGAAKRGDELTMTRHRELLKEIQSPELTEIYNIISRYIWETSKRI